MNNIKKTTIILAMILLIPVELYILRDSLVKRGYKAMMLTQADYINAAEYYMKQKYGEKFEGEFYYEDDVYAHPKARPEWNVIINVEREGGMVYFHDNYVGFLKKAELESYIYELIKPIYGECKVYTDPFGFPLDDSWNRDTDIMTYVGGSNFVTYIFTDKNTENKEADCKETCDIFIDKKIESTDLRIIYLTKEDLEKFEERDIDYTFHAYKYYYRIYVIYDKKTKTGFTDMDILKGADNYGE
jgi:hypothetical protein